MAVSKGQRITVAQMFSVNPGRAAVSVDPAGSVVEFVGDGVEVGLVQSTQVSALG
jgi:hypothetical protein